MSINIRQQLVVAISSRALFNLDDSHAIFETEGLSAYANYQIRHENDILPRGQAFSLVEKLLALRAPDTHAPLVDVILLSRNSADTGLRIFNSINHYQLNITRAAFTSGESPWQYVSAFSSDLFLSSHPQDVHHALTAGHAAATIFPCQSFTNQQSQLRIAFDGDAVLFSDESERIYQQKGLEAFCKNEKDNANNPLPGGPFKGFLQALHSIQRRFPPDNCPIRTALVTARAAPAHERIIRTLRAWDIRIDEALFLGGLSKGEFLKAFQADFFFDDQHIHCQSAAEHVSTAHVPHGIVNQKSS